MWKIGSLAAGDKGGDRDDATIADGKLRAGPQAFDDVLLLVSPESGGTLRISSEDTLVDLVMVELCWEKAGEDAMVARVRVAAARSFTVVILSMVYQPP